MTHYTPSREQWEQEKQDQHDEYWTWINTEAENFVKEADTNKINIEKMPDIEILNRIGELVEITPEDMDGVNQGITSIVYKQTIFFFKH